MYDLDDIEKDDDQQDELPEFMKPEDSDLVDDAEGAEPTDYSPDDDEDNHGNR
jgi:hypothetical protein